MFTLPKDQKAKIRYWRERRRMMRDLLKDGWNMGEIGRKYGISRQAVRKCILRGNP